MTWSRVKAIAWFQKKARKVDLEAFLVKHGKPASVKGLSLKEEYVAAVLDDIKRNWPPGDVKKNSVLGKYAETTSSRNASKLRETRSRKEAAQQKVLERLSLDESHFRFVAKLLQSPYGTVCYAAMATQSQRKAHPYVTITRGPSPLVTHPRINWTDCSKSDPKFAWVKHHPVKETTVQRGALQPKLERKRFQGSYIPELAPSQDYNVSTSLPNSTKQLHFTLPARDCSLQLRPRNLATLSPRHGLHVLWVASNMNHCLPRSVCLYMDPAHTLVWQCLQEYGRQSLCELRFGVWIFQLVTSYAGSIPGEITFKKDTNVCQYEWDDLQETSPDSDSESEASTIDDDDE